MKGSRTRLRKVLRFAERPEFCDQYARDRGSAETVPSSSRRPLPGRKLHYSLPILSFPLQPLRPHNARTRARRRGAITADRFYLPRANANKKIAVSLRWIEFSLALAATVITAMVGIAGKELFGIKFDFVALTAVLTTVGGAVLAHIEATRCDFLVVIYRATARRLSAEIANIGDVNALPAEKWSDFVNRCEAIISDENTSWAAKWTKA
jgi:SMODS and SLOG-associating 2TM effector domain 1